MPREQFVQKLVSLQDAVLYLGSLVENALVESVDILLEQDTSRARQLIASDEEINRRRFSIESDALTLIATQQPMASDLRVLAAVLEIITELERIGDYAKGIAKITTMMEGRAIPDGTVDLMKMAKQGQSMLHRSLDAFVRRDVSLARAIPKEDDIVDDLYNHTYRSLLEMIMEDTSIIDEATHVLWVAHNLERAADRVVNICERVVFTVTGEMIEMTSGA